ncbi:hypothetical protein C5N14_12260 [Micromonospora sp. MW-13]|nr:hypothetical protein C5N14_12260 [Micromonospora sp. MW-13]
MSRVRVVQLTSRPDFREPFDRLAGGAVWLLPTVIIEALASGRPVLGTALDGIPYLLGADAPREPAGTGPAAVATATPGRATSPCRSGCRPARRAGWWPPEPAAMAAALPVARAGTARLAPAARARYERTFTPTWSPAS